MKTIYLFVFFLIINSSLFAQQTVTQTSGYKIKGRLMDSISNHPLEYATVSLFLKGEKKPANGSIADSKGNFVVDNVAPGNYKLVAEFIGYKAHTLLNLSVNKENPLVDVKNIFLASKTTTLQNISVAVQGKLIENKIDKLVFNAERDLTSQVGVATDILKKVPQVSVDVDGNVELAGSSSIRFLINGKPSSAFGSSISDVLQSIPASQIKSIEVITNPGAKYDAQGLGGIINIILKQNNSQGINGNLSLTGGTRMENGSFNFAARKRNFGVNAFISNNVRLKAPQASSSDRLTNDTSANTTILLHQDGTSSFLRSGYQTGVGFDWDLSKHNNFSGAISYNHFNNTGTGSTNQSQITTGQNGDIISTIPTFINTDHTFHFRNLDANLNYKKTFAKEDQSLELSVNSSTGSRTSIDNNYQFSLPQKSLYYSTMGNNPGTEKETEIKADYSQPLKKDVLLGVGSKVSFYDVTSNSHVLQLDPSSSQYVKDNFLSNSLDYHQKVYALYSEISFPVFNLFDAKIGGRYERTEVNSFYSNAQQQTKIPGYNTFVPSIFFSKKIGENAQLKLSFSKRIERPDYWDLNPFINTSDPKNLSTGNPNLQPEIGKRYELGYSADINKVGSVMVNLFYRTNEHDIQPFIVYYPSYQVGDTTYTNVAVSTRQNIGRENNIGVNLFGDFKFIPKLNLRTNVFFFERHTINVIDKGYDYNSFNYRANLNASYQFSSTLAAEFFGDFHSPRHEAQGKYPSFTTYSIAVRQQFWNKKGSLALTASNPFKKNVDQKTEVFGPNFTINGLRSIPYRSIGINFTWKFGKLEFKKDKEKPNDSLNAPADNG
ncbi:MAG: TonB-dependent receptor [Bacteroidota bacterium]|nr:TonB-dependent receptor [Bacteroidota bacterium]